VFKRYEWRLRLPVEEVLARLDATMIGEDALRVRMTERLEDQFCEWRSANRPMGRVAGSRFRLFMPRELLRNPMAPMLRGRVLATENGSRITARVGFSWKSILLLAFLFGLYSCIAIPWMIIRFQEGKESVAYILLMPFGDIAFIGFVVIFALFRWVARADVKGFVSFLNEQFQHDIIRDEPESTA